MPEMFKLNYPITTPEAKAFWASRHKCNKMKSIIAFSLDLKNANDNLRRAGYNTHWRKRALNNFGNFVNKPDMTDIPFTEMDVPWWVCMPYDPTIDPPISCLWVDQDIWVDPSNWKEC